MDTPCHKCEERTVGCHAVCEKYQKFQEALQKEQEERRKERYVNDYFGTRKVKVARCFKNKGNG